MNIQRKLAEKHDFFVFLTKDKKGIEIVKRDTFQLTTSLTCEKEKFTKERMEKVFIDTDRWDIPDPTFDMFTGRVRHFHRTGLVSEVHGYVCADYLVTATQTDITTVKPRGTRESRDRFIQLASDALKLHNIDINDMIFEEFEDDDDDDLNPYISLCAFS